MDQFRPFRPGASGPGVDRQRPNPMLDGAFDPRTGWPFVLLDHFRPRPGRVAKLWFVRTRKTPQVMGSDPWPDLEVMRFGAEGELVERGVDELLAAVAGRPVYVQVLGLDDRTSGARRVALEPCLARSLRCVAGKCGPGRVRLAEPSHPFLRTVRLRGKMAPLTHRRVPPRASLDGVARGGPRLSPGTELRRHRRDDNLPPPCRGDDRGSAKGAGRRDRGSSTRPPGPGDFGRRGVLPSLARPREKLGRALEGCEAYLNYFKLARSRPAVPHLLPMTGFRLVLGYRTLSPRQRVALGDLERRYRDVDLAPHIGLAAFAALSALPPRNRPLRSLPTRGPARSRPFSSRKPGGRSSVLGANPSGVTASYFG
ncbi:hypothetical protein Pan216_41950 [Planctomycetes bacterium Pan216]|uniref:Uncharacterized protein n=1 Tax=Kolteria novifilia TaxID=2527975 RepID=A0A518B8L4_9BACT|nr:hypothetical protein Pan216_41950 [Planctomycetes bacterium Pan216]